ncbi:MAG: SDR family oxidoreductase [Nakamurella sp.]
MVNVQAHDESAYQQVIVAVGTDAVLTAALQERCQLSGYGLTGLSSWTTHDGNAAALSEVALVDSGSGRHHRRYDLTGIRIRAVVYLPSAPAEGRIPQELRRITDILRRAGSTDAPFYLMTAAATDHSTALGPESPSSSGGVEEVLRSTGHPHSVVRTSTLIGDSGTGAIAEFGTVYRLCKALLGARRPRIPFSPGARVDLIPCDVVADVLVRLIENGFVGGDYWLTGGEHALTVEQAVTELLSAARQAGLPVAHQSVVFDDSWAGRRYVSDGGGNSPLIVDSPLPSSLGNQFETALGELGAIGTPALPGAIDALRASLRYWAGTVAAERVLVA